MAVPNLTIAAEPIEAGKAVYLPLAAKAADQVPQVKIVLRLRITNNTQPPQVVVVNAIQFSFPGSAAPSKDMQGIPSCSIPTVPPRLRRLWAQFSRAKPPPGQTV
jgi:hypothetical protein